MPVYPILPPPVEPIPPPPPPPEPLRLSAVERSMVRPDVAETVARTRVFDGGPDR